MKHHLQTRRANEAEEDILEVFRRMLNKHNAVFKRCFVVAVESLVKYVGKYNQVRNRNKNTCFKIERIVPEQESLLMELS